MGEHVLLSSPYLGVCHIGRVEPVDKYGWAHVFRLCDEEDLPWSPMTLPPRDRVALDIMVDDKRSTLHAGCRAAWLALRDHGADDLGTPSLLDLLAGDAA